MPEGLTQSQQIYFDAIMECLDDFDEEEAMEIHTRMTQGGISDKKREVMQTPQIQKALKEAYQGLLEEDEELANKFARTFNLEF